MRREALRTARLELVTLMVARAIASMSAPT
jgi:hypothetical protein